VIFQLILVYYFYGKNNNYNILIILFGKLVYITSLFLFKNSMLFIYLVNCVKFFLLQTLYAIKCKVLWTALHLALQKILLLLLLLYNGVDKAL